MKRNGFGKIDIFSFSQEKFFLYVKVIFRPTKKYFLFFKYLFLSVYIRDARKKIQ